jgi:hypothetical protein
MMPVAGGAGTLTSIPGPTKTGGFPVELIGRIWSIGKISRRGPVVPRGVMVVLPPCSTGEV